MPYADSSAQETGLSLAVARMSRGERARVWVQDAKYGYGDRGSFSFPHVPPRAQLVYDVDMISWEDVPEVGVCVIGSGCMEACTWMHYYEDHTAAEWPYLSCSTATMELEFAKRA